jgi:uncharacterized SAM-binding protein YcdF (DUF218 family)
MIRRILSLVALAWLLGFGWFALFLPQPLGNQRTDAIVVFTGGPHRIDRAFDLLVGGQARRMMISGVAPDVTPAELAAEYRRPLALIDCCVALGREAVDTRGNGEEVARWMERRGYASVRLVTTDWHMRRARFELTRALPGSISVIADAVPSRPTLWTLFNEYNKLVLRWFGALIGV